MWTDSSPLWWTSFPVSPEAAHLSASLFVTMELGVCPPPSTGSFPSCLLPSTSSRSCQQVKQIWGSQCLYFGPQNRKYTVGHRGHGEPTGILGNGGQVRGCTAHHRRGEAEPGACWEGEWGGLHFRCLPPRPPPLLSMVHREGDHIIYCPNCDTFEHEEGAVIKNDTGNRWKPCGRIVRAGFKLLLCF